MSKDFTFLGVPTSELRKSKILKINKLTLKPNHLNAFGWNVKNKMSLAKNFNQILQRKASELVKGLNKGATDKKIEKLQKVINSKLPDDFVEFYKIHNGQDDEFKNGLFEAEELLSIERIIDEYGVWKELLNDGDFEDSNSEPQMGIKNDWWNPLWIPITHDGSGNHYCLDLDPAEGGTWGQVIRFWHDDGERTIKANSFTEFINDHIVGIENGEYIYSEDYAGFVEKEYLD